MIDPQRIPVIVGIGECIDRDNLQEPRALLAEAARIAGAEAAGLLQQVDSIDVVAIMSCQYDKIGQLLASDLGISPAHAEESVAGGEKPVRLLGEVAERIAAGTSKVALICGAEAMRTRARAAQNGPPLDWGPVDPTAKPLTALDFVTPHAARYGLVQPTHVYPLYENATRHTWGQSFSQAQQESARIWSQNADAASGNASAWLGKPHSAEQIIEDSDSNRMIAYPYRKLMVANPMVNQAGAILVTSLARAQAAGIPPSKIIYIWSGARANEASDFLIRDRFDHSTAQDAVLQSTLAQAELQPSDIDLVEFYSCFPTVPKMARRTLGFPLEKRLSLAGGLTFFGGPANNYMTHALAAAVRELREHKGHNALIYGQGEFVTKHAAIVLANTPPLKSPQMLDVQADANAAAGPQSRLLESYQGAATIESFTIIYDRNGTPSQAPVVARTPNGERVICLVPGDDQAVINLLLSQDPIGRDGYITHEEQGLLRFHINAPT
ncbi:Acetyl-CoA C-acetyltransferase [Pseudomonas sp. 9AZ]|uniref:acetyl-CoA acetyltransferase n=1 Tax=Pseudomonas sp. 9AZ TaxID=2653168 RepID=UPI0012F466E6|nr:acetyl-CoA acetyltransferase [Pseudomonas sp. 9AZ]VXD04166.1 Acetyl-CoA C-acetyltransferase [Pseudomonas sp. 9AZ]